MLNVLGPVQVRFRGDLVREVDLFCRGQNNDDPRWRFGALFCQLIEYLFNSEFGRRRVA